MRRKVFDLIASIGGLVVVAVLVVAGGLLMWGSSFTTSSVHNQLARQDITFPAKAAFEHAKPGTEITPGMKPYLMKYAGKQLTTGAQAEAYANHFIAVHLSEMPYHGVYATISNAARTATPGSAKATQLSALEATSFQGTTLRGLLLEAYAFSVFGTIAFWSSLASFAAALVMACLVALGFWHARRTPEETELLATARPAKLQTA